MSAESQLAALYPPDEEEVDTELYFSIFVAVDFDMGFKIVAFDNVDECFCSSPFLPILPGNASRFLVEKELIIASIIHTIN